MGERERERKREERVESGELGPVSVWSQERSSTLLVAIGVFFF